MTLLAAIGRPVRPWAVVRAGAGFPLRVAALGGALLLVALLPGAIERAAGRPVAMAVEPPATAHRAAAASTTSAGVSALSASDRAAIERLLYAAKPSATHAAVFNNAANDLSAALDPSGISVSTSAGTVSVRLTGVGREDAIVPVRADGSASVDGPRVAFPKSAGTNTVEEWWLNRPTGLEQGFTLTSRPAGGGPLHLSLTLAGSLAPRLTDGDEVSFVGPDGSAGLRYAGLAAWDSQGRSLPARLELHGPSLAIVVDDRSAAYPLTVDPNFFQQAYLKASNTDAGDQFGTSVAVSGDTVVVGAPVERGSATGVNGSDDNAALQSGAAYVFVRSGGVWSQQAYLKASNTGVADQFGRSVAVSGDTVVVGAPFEDGSATGVNGSDDNAASIAGAAYVFVRSGGVWSQQAYLKASNTGADDRFGRSVAVSGDTVVVGAHLEDGSATGVNGSDDNAASTAGAAYVFVLDSAAPSSTIDFPAAASYGASGWAAGCSGAGGFCGSASDGLGGSGVQKVEWSLRQGSGDYWGGSAFDQASETFFPATGTTGWSQAFPISNFLADGGYTLHVRATDNAGNVETDPSVTFTISRPSSLLYTGAQVDNLYNPFAASAQLACAAASLTGKSIDFTLDSDPTTGAAGSFSLGSASTNSGGVAAKSVATTSPANWLEGVYQITATFAGDGDCDPSSDQATLVVGSAGDAAHGGGWYTLNGSGRSNFGFAIKKQKDGSYRGQFLLINQGKWRLKGTLTSFTKSGSSGGASGTGTLYYLDNAGHWVATSANPTSFTISFSDGGPSKKGSAKADTFGIHINHAIVSPPEPGTLPNSSPQSVKRGDIRIR